MWVRSLTVAGIVSLLVGTQVCADVILPNTHTVTRCATIGNLAEFPDIAVVGGYTTASKRDSVVRYIVGKDTCLNKGYKFNTFYLFWVAKSFLESQGLEKLPLINLLPVVSAKRLTTAGGVATMGLIPIGGELFSGLVPDSIAAVKEQLTYKLKMANDGEDIAAVLAEKVSVDKNNVEIRVSYEPVVQVERGAARIYAATRNTLNLHPHLSRSRLTVTPEFTGKLTGTLFDCRGSVVGRFSREVKPGATYLVPCNGSAAGMYWLRARSGTATVNVRLSTLD